MILSNCEVSWALKYSNCEHCQYYCRLAGRDYCAYCCSFGKILRGLK